MQVVVAIKRNKNAEKIVAIQTNAAKDDNWYQ